MTRIPPHPENPLAAKVDIASEIAQKVFEENGDAIYRAMLKALLKGDPKVFAALADRAYGKLTQKVEIPGIENLPDLIAEARKRRGGNPPVEHRFNPGQNGNPGGRPQRDIAANIARAIFEKNPELIERNSRRLRGRLLG